MKIICLILACISVAGCVVSSASDSHLKYGPAGSWMTWFQKKDRLGNTDYHQRIRDFYACGIPRDQIIDEHWTMWTTSDFELNLSLQEFSLKREKTINCMKNKGYILATIEQCGTVANPTGICK